MQWSDIQFSPSDRTLRQFAGLCLLVFGLLATVETTVRQRPQLALVYGVVALIVGPLGLVRPQAVRPIYVGWSVLAFPIGWLVSTIILGVLFYGMFTPMAIVFRLMGRDVLARRRAEVRTVLDAKARCAESARLLPAKLRSGMNDFQKLAQSEQQQNIFSELWHFMRQNKKWWLLPIVIVMLGFGLLVLLSGTAAAPFIYTLF